MTPNRLTCDLYTVKSTILDLKGDAVGEHKLEMHVGYAPGDPARVVEVAFVGRGKCGQGIDLLFADVGLWVSRVLQGRDPQTGDPAGTAGTAG